MNRAQNKAFTLIEMMTAVTILSVLVVVLALMMNSVSKIWTGSRGKITALQNGRVILEFMARDFRRLAAPKISFATNLTQSHSFPAYSLAYIQFLQDAGKANSGLQEWLPGGQTQVTNSSNVFGQFYGDSTARGNLWIFGYYLAEDGNKVRHLYRLAVPPADPNNPANANADYKLFVSGSGAQPDNDTSASHWMGGAAMFARDKYSFPLGDNVIAFYVVCLDHRQRPIPWLQNHNAAAAPLKFNSAAAFVMPQSTGVSNSAGAGNDFVYLQAPATNIPARPAHRLPAALRISILTADKNALKRFAAQSQTLPNPPDLSGYLSAHELDYDQAAIRDYQRELGDAPYRLAGVQLFTLNINLNQGTP